MLLVQNKELSVYPVKRLPIILILLVLVQAISSTSGLNCFLCYHNQ